MKRYISTFFNIFLILMIAAVMFMLTMYSHENSEVISRGNIVNIVFLSLMTVGIVVITGYYIGKANIITSDLRKKDDELKEEKWKNIDFKSKCLIPAFQKYKADMNDQKCSINCDISDYINVRLLNQAIRKNLCESVSASMTGFGMLGTFLGLIIGLHGFNTSYSEMQNSIMLLLGGIKTAFLTSIYGVTFSLVFNYIYRKAYSKMIDALDSFQDNFYRNAVGNVQNEVNSKLVKQSDTIENLSKTQEEQLNNNTELLEIQKKQSDTIENLSKTIKETMSELSNNMSTQLGKYLEELNKGLTKHFNDSLELQRNASKQMVEEYLKEMNDKVLEVQKEKLNTMFTNFAQISKDALGSSTALSNVAASLTEQHKGFIEANSNMLELTNELKMSVSELKEYQQTVAESQLDYSRQLAEHKNHMDVTTAEFDERLTNYIERVGKANTTLDETVRMLDRSIQGVAVGNAQLLDTLNRNEKQLEITGNQIDKFLVSASELTEKVKQNSENLTAYIESAKEASVNVAESIHTELIEDFRTSSEQLKLLNDELKQVTDSLSQTYRDLSNGLGDTFRNFDENTANIAEQFLDMLENIRTTADYIPRRLNDALETYFGVNNANDTSEKMIPEYDSESVISEHSYDSKKEFFYGVDGIDTELDKSEE